MSRTSAIIVIGLILTTLPLVTPAQAQTFGTLSNNIIPNEFIVTFKETADPQATIQQDALAELQEVNQDAGVIATRPLSALDHTYIYKTNGSFSREAMLEAYGDVDAVESIEPDRLMSFMEIPNDPDFGKQWALNKIQTEQAWGSITGSRSVVVAVIDSGCEASHPDLSGNIIESKVFDDPQFISGHGTHVCGIIGAIGNNARGTTGTNWTVGIMDLKTDAIVSGQHGLRMSKVADAIIYATQNGADVINLSLGGSASSVLKDAIDQATAAGVLVVAAAGNTASQNYNLFPAAWPNVISVSAVGPNDELASYSSFGKVDVAAPGGNVSTDRNGDGKKNVDDCIPEECIYSTWLQTQGGYKSNAGTSMAAPHVSGVAALMLAAKPQLTADAVRTGIESSAVDLGDSGKDVRFGHGRLDAFKALQAVGAASGSGTNVTPSPIPTGTTGTGGGNGHPCFLQAEQGDYNCDSTIAMNDFQSWRQDFIANLSYASAIFFEQLRNALLH